VKLPLNSEGEDEWFRRLSNCNYLKGTFFINNSAFSFEFAAYESVIVHLYGQFVFIGDEFTLNFISNEIGGL